jgi:zinc transport system ATP-binding protein
MAAIFGDDKRRKPMSAPRPHAEQPAAPAHNTTVEPVLVVEHLEIGITGKTVVRDVSFSLPPRASLAVIGPNGAGKTLLLQSLLGLIPSRGNIRWRTAARLGYVPQRVETDARLPLRAGELLRAKAKVQRLPESDVRAAVDWAGVGPLLEQRVGTLSAGQFQRLLIAFALAGSPDVLLVDEPTASLDELAEEHIFELLEKARRERGMTIILVSHDLTLVRGTASHVLCLGGGKAWFGTAAEMLVPELLERVYGQPLEFHSHDLEGNA